MQLKSLPLLFRPLIHEGRQSLSHLYVVDFSRKIELRIHLTGQDRTGGEESYSIQQAILDRLVQTKSDYGYYGTLAWLYSVFSSIPYHIHYTVIMQMFIHGVFDAVSFYHKISLYSSFLILVISLCKLPPKHTASMQRNHLTGREITYCWLCRL